MQKILIKGAGDLASGIAWRLRRAGFNVLMTEIAQPLTVRLTVSYSNAVYEGEVVGERNREGDLMLNPTRTKKLTNLRASGHDEAVTLTPVSKPTLEQAIQFIKDDELVEVTPESIRMCKKVLDTQQRKILYSRGEIPSYLLK